MKPATFIIQTLAMAGLQPPPDGVHLARSDVTPPAEPTRLEEHLKLDRSFTLAAHRSHSSHRSHGSHRSSSGGSVPRYAPAPAPSVPWYYNPTPSVPRTTPAPGDVPATRNYDSTPPSSVLPSSPSVSPKIQERIRGNTKAFQVLVYKVQVALYAQGYYTGAIDGLIGPQTRAAISSYQRSRGLPITGTINDELLDALNITLD